MTRPTIGERLPCGRSWDALLEQVADGRRSGPGPHQQTCPHCQAVLAELGRMWAPVRHLAAEQVHTPPALLSKVMEQVRAATRQSWHALITGEQGSTRVAARVIATLARLAAARVPGVHVALGRTTDARAASRAAAATDQHDASGSAGGSTVVELAVAAQYDVPLHALAEDVRAAVTHELTTRAGLRNVQVDVTIEDILA